jgi:hypothetical protein
MNPQIQNALKALDEFVSRANMSRQEHLVASQLAQRLMTSWESAEQEIVALKKANQELAMKFDSMVQAEKVRDRDKLPPSFCIHPNDGAVETLPVKKD